MITNLRCFRKNRGLTQGELAKMAGISKISLVRYEQGATNPNVDIVRRLAAALGVTVDELIEAKRRCS